MSYAIEARLWQLWPQIAALCVVVIAGLVALASSATRDTRHNRSADSPGRAVCALVLDASGETSGPVWRTPFAQRFAVNDAISR
jgi:hypothetical protein